MFSLSGRLLSGSIFFFLFFFFKFFFGRGERAPFSLSTAPLSFVISLLPLLQHPTPEIRKQNASFCFPASTKKSRPTVTNSYRSHRLVRTGYQESWSGCRLPLEALSGLGTRIERYAIDHSPSRGQQPLSHSIFYQF